MSYFRHDRRGLHDHVHRPDDSGRGAAGEPFILAMLILFPPCSLIAVIKISQSSWHRGSRHRSYCQEPQTEVAPHHVATLLQVRKLFKRMIATLRFEPQLQIE